SSGAAFLSAALSLLSYLSFIHHTLRGLLVRASDHIPDFHPAAIADAPLIRLHLLSIFDQTRLTVAIPCVTTIMRR
ncbi:hypothetical protein XENOCAPTIV_005932, partial [Xenoophorus captivus]